MHARFILGLLVFLAAGCSSARSQVAAVQAEKEQLIAAIREQKQELSDLRSRNETLAAQLNKAEIEIARGPSFGERRLANHTLERDAIVGSGTVKSSPAPAAVASQKRIEPPPVSEVPSQLDWRPNRSEAKSGTVAAGSSAVSSDDLKAWAAQREWLQYDEPSQSVTVALPLKFQGEGDTLENDAKNLLDELATLLKSDEGKRLRVLVAGQPAPAGVASAVDGAVSSTNPRHLGSSRALAVTDYLDRHGISSDRLGVTAVVAEQSATADDTAPKLSIHVLPGDVPVIGWTPPVNAIRR